MSDLNPFLDNSKANSLMDRHLMGQKTAKDPIGEIWCVRGEKGKSPVIVKVNNIITEKLGFTAYEMEGGMLATDLMTRDETIKVHIDKYFDSAFDTGKSIVMRDHGQGFQLRKKEGGYEDVKLAIVFVKEDKSLQGARMIPQKPDSPFMYGCLRVIFQDDFNKQIED